LGDSNEKVITPIYRNPKGVGVDVWEAEDVQDFNARFFEVTITLKYFLCASIANEEVPISVQRYTGRGIGACFLTVV